MRALFCAIALMLCLVPAFAETRATSFSPLSILFRFDGPYSQAAFQEMEKELTVLMEPSGVRPEWHDRRDIAQSESFERLVIVNFHGTCRPEPAASPAPADGSKPLGWTHVVDGKVLPFSDVECDRVRASIHSANGMRPLSDLVLGRALARVLAHELHHVVARTSAHRGAGIAKPSLSGVELSSERLELKSSGMDRTNSAPDARR